MSENQINPAETTAATVNLLERLERYFKPYSALSPGLALVLALWSLATHLFATFDCFPYLGITSPTKRCGKTRLAELLELVCANPLRTVGISVAALFRSIEKKKPTLLIDEAEALRGKDERASALREILNAGYRQGQKVLRCAGAKDGDYKLREFKTFCPKALILIGTLPDTLADRCIPIAMKRRTHERLERFRFLRVKGETQPLREEMKRWARANRARVEGWYQKNDVACLEDREAELWLPLFTVCAVVAPERLPELESIALQLSRMKSAAEPADRSIRLLTDIRGIFAAGATDRLSTTTLLYDLDAIEESPWPGWSRGSGLDARSLSWLLRPFGIQPKNLRLDQKQVVKGYEKGDFEDAWARYLGPAAATSATALIPQQDSSDSASATQQACSASKTEGNPNVYAGCSDVADRKPQYEEAPLLAGYADEPTE